MILPLSAAEQYLLELMTRARLDPAGEALRMGTAHFRTGVAYNDILAGNAGADRLNGGIGNDLIKGGRGSDMLIAGTGSDTFVFNAGDGLAWVSNCI